MTEHDYRATLEMLQRALEIEYQFITNYSNLAKIMHNEELASKLKVLGEDSIKHADMVSDAIIGLDGLVSIPVTELLPEDLDLKGFFSKQLELEKKAFVLYSEAAEKLGEELKPAFCQIAAQEQCHIKMEID